MDPVSRHFAFCHQKSARGNSSSFFVVIRFSCPSDPLPLRYIPCHIKCRVTYQHSSLALLKSWLHKASQFALNRFSKVCHVFPWPRLKMIDRRFRARKAFCGSQVRNISCTRGEIWKASKYRRLDLKNQIQTSFTAGNSFVLASLRATRIR